MKRLEDVDLIDELKKRFKENNQILEELNSMTEKLKSVNKKLVESENLKSHFLSNIRNEINNPLAAILGLSENMMYEKEKDINVIHSMSKMIHSEAFNLDFQLRIIFAAAEIEAGEAHLHVTHVNIPELIEKCIASFQQSADLKTMNIQFENQLEVDFEGNFTFQTDSEKFHLILSNLFSNSVEYGEKGKKIIVKSWMADGKLMISVQDFGIGIPKADQSRIFDRFVQLDSGLTKRFRGHGLGLSVTRDAVEILKGTINVSSNLGKGSTFTVSLMELVMPEEDDDIFSSDGNEELF